MKIKFIIGQNKRGKPIQSYCDQKSMFITNKRTRPYLNSRDPYSTKIIFKRGVLDKYLYQPDKYVVEPLTVRCINREWIMSVDNDSSDYVIVFLGDLNNLPSYEEQCHWRSYNVPIDAKMSKSAYGNAFYCDFSEPEQPDHLFKIKYQRFNKRFK